jgi:hypothetical protein
MLPRAPDQIPKSPSNSTELTWAKTQILATEASVTREPPLNCGGLSWQPEIGAQWQPRPDGLRLPAGPMGHACRTSLALARFKYQSGFPRR